MTAVALTYRLAGAYWALRLGESALATFACHVQRGHHSKESVGQMYARALTGDCVVVEHVTVLRPKRAWFNRVQFDPQDAMAERRRLRRRGLHFVGLWHTHPELTPQPSHEDLALARDHARAAKPERNGLVFVILGTAAPAEGGLRVWVDDGQVLFEAGLQGNDERNDVEDGTG
ncbi:Mov34/MPN/PAD-1 family protein [Pseudomonas sp. R2.Fl]|nr:Mov34/MPN/PAD-1 family protein [Pseudomonas sp. R2.Fl]